MSNKQDAIDAIEAYVNARFEDDAGFRAPDFARKQADELMRIVENTIHTVTRNPRALEMLKLGAEAKPRNVIMGDM